MEKPIKQQLSELFDAIADPKVSITRVKAKAAILHDDLSDTNNPISIEDFSDLGPDDCRAMAMGLCVISALVAQTIRE